MPPSRVLDSRLRGNDDSSVSRNARKTETEQTGFPPARE
ncbi:hypothetical protein NMH_0782 [Neisseria meningitidis H44/76]|uniref:Uncharacterized protein n=3 Tax=Neisseria meningitidis TaxID=487 RepID=E6MVU4_NEIMH|nr:hypothetical protein NMH_0782 [Neisseria meningitidis H44/76]KER40371.1 hypothetical protein F528_0700 [Neisseria meningitidis 992008]CBA09066.1 hypothetical protein predicted by Glimmer/Critica [Neisseria meningitidis alpha153]CCA45274.1 hypothetical protein NMALPHA522_1733 [Neisseria meningitidis alpha522]